MRLGLIYARARNGAIGKDGVMPWHLPEDLAHFRAVTNGHPVIMGRRTWESLPPRFRPLPGRRNIVVTRNPAWQAPGAETASSLDAALALCAGEPQAWVIGGAQLFHEALARAQVAEVTQLEHDFEGDVFMPEPGEGWNRTQASRHESAGGIPFSFNTYTRTATGG